MTKPSYHLVLLGIFLQFINLGFLGAQSFQYHPRESGFFYHNANGVRSSLSFPYATQLTPELIWRVGDQNGYGLVDEDGEVILKPTYDYIGGFKDDLTIVIDDGYFGVINKEGTLVLDVFHDAIYSFSNDSIYLKLDGLLMVYVDEQYIPIDSSMLGFLRIDRSARVGGCGEFVDDNYGKFCASQIYKGVQYPKYAREHGYEGQVLVELTIDAQGTVLEEEIIQSVGGGCDEEALRLIHENVSYWLPALEGGQPIESTITVPIRFVLQ